MKEEKQIPEEIRNMLLRVLEDLEDLIRKFDDRPYRLTGGFDDLVQEVRAAALGSLDKFKQDGDLEESFRRWVFSIAKHKYADEQRRAGRFASAASDAILEQAEQDGLTPSRAMGIQEGLDRLAECLLKLAEREREILKLNRVDKMSVREIAKRMGMTEGAIWNLLRRVTIELRTCWGSSGAYRFMAKGR